MAFCKYCGNELKEGAAFCPQCGQPVAPAEQPVVEQPVAEQPVVEQPVVEQPFAEPSVQPVYQTPVSPFAAQPVPVAPKENVWNPTDKAQEYDPDDIAKNKDRAFISYLGLFFLPPLLGAKHSPYAQFHAKQGFNLCLLTVAVWVTMTIFTAILGLIYGPLALLGTILSTLCNLFLLVLVVFGIINALTGKVKGLPLIGGIRILK